MLPAKFEDDEFSSELELVASASIPSGGKCKVQEMNV